VSGTLVGKEGLLEPLYRVDCSQYETHSQYGEPTNIAIHVGGW